MQTTTARKIKGNKYLLLVGQWYMDTAYLEYDHDKSAWIATSTEDGLVYPVRNIEFVSKARAGEE